MARQNKKGLSSGKVVRVLKGRKRLGKIAKEVAANVFERIPPLSEPLDAVDTSASDESCRRLGRVSACPMKTKAACVVRTASTQAGSPTAGATLVGTPNCVAHPSVDEVNPPGLPTGNPPTRSDLVRRIERAIMLPGEQTRMIIGGKRVRGNRSLVDARRNHRKDLMRRTSERKIRRNTCQTKFRFFVCLQRCSRFNMLRHSDRRL